MSNGSQISGAELFSRQQSQQNYNGPTIICDGIQTPENFGSILRVADAIGSQGIWLLDSELDLTSKRLSRLARSASQHLNIKQFTLQQFLQQHTLFNYLYALEITTCSTNLFEADIKNCDGIIIGHEATGIREELLQCCNSAIHLPMFGVNGSMNVSHALAVFLYEWRRQQ